MVFTDASTKIQEFIKNKTKSIFHLKETSKPLLKTLYNLALTAGNHQFKIISEKQCLPNAPFPKGRMFDLIGFTLLTTHINKLNKLAIETKLIVGIRTYNIHFILPLGSSTKFNVEEALLRIHTWLYIASQYAETTCSKVVNVYIYLTELKKSLPKTFGKHIDIEHVNTAFTTGCNESTEIIIFRKEEWFKVFIHESFHNLGFDFDFSGKSRQALIDIFPLQSKCLLNETYCELWAEIFNIILINASSHKTFEEIVPVIERQIQIEREFSFFQTAKILDYFDLNYIELFEKSSEAEKLRKNYKENTEVFCYYILKTLLLSNLNDFIEWIHVNCSGIKFKQELVDKFVNELIIPKYNEIKYIKIIDKMQNYFDKPSNNQFINNTLRMTVFELL